MTKHQVFKRIKKKDIPPGRWCVKSKSVFKKQNGVFHARLVACGYSQIPGVDFTENYSPMVHGITFCLFLIAKMIYGFSAKIVDVETAFLHGDLDKEIFMNCPEGLEDTTDQDALKLHECIYGLVQVARQYHKKKVEVLQRIRFEGGNVEPFLYMNRDKHGLIYKALYVDDNLLIRDKKTIDHTIKAHKKAGLVLKVYDSLEDYLSCEIKFTNNSQSAWLGQPHLIGKLKNKFGDKVKKLQIYRTPGTSGLNIVHNSDPQDLPDKQDHKEYRSGVGILLWLVKYSRPNIANSMRELTKVLDSPNKVSYKKMLCVMKFVLHTKHFGLCMWPFLEKDLPWELLCFTDSDYAGDLDSRRSVSGYIIFIQGVPVAWRSKSHQSVTISSSEAERIALSKDVKDIIFILLLFKMMQVKVKYPVIVHINNSGAIFMENNVTTSLKTEHVNICNKYVHKYVEDGIVKIIFVRSEDNTSDIMTKNIHGNLYDKHSSQLVSC